MVDNPARGELTGFFFFAYPRTRGDTPEIR